MNDTSVPESVPEVDVDELERVLDGGALVVDVREVEEHTEARIAGVRLIPLDTVPDEADSLPTDAPVYIVCARGGRSHKAAEYLRGRGIDAINVAGGTLGWIEAGKPVETG